MAAQCAWNLQYVWARIEMINCFYWFYNFHWMFALASTRRPTPVSMWLRAVMCLCIRNFSAGKRKPGKRGRKRCMNLPFNVPELLLHDYESVLLLRVVHVTLGTKSHRCERESVSCMTWKFRCATDKSKIHSLLKIIRSFRQSSFIGDTPPSRHFPIKATTMYPFFNFPGIKVPSPLSAWALFCAPDYSCSQCDFNYTRTFPNIRCFVMRPIFGSAADKFPFFSLLASVMKHPRILQRTAPWQSRGRRVLGFQVLLFEEFTKKKELWKTNDLFDFWQIHQHSSTADQIIIILYCLMWPNWRHIRPIPMKKISKHSGKQIQNIITFMYNRSSIHVGRVCGEFILYFRETAEKRSCK